MKRGGEIYIFLVIGLVLASGCISKTDGQNMITYNSTVDLAISKCQELCENLIESGEDLTNGPCLSDEYEWNVSDWVCDIAHKPRMPIDNNPENQCRDYRSGIAHHFVELTPNCDFIRAI